MNETKKVYTGLKTIKHSDTEIELQGEIPVDILKSYAEAALARLQKSFNLKGFREGTVPSHLVRQRVGEYEILEDAAESALQDAYLQIVSDQKLDIIGRPDVSITAIVPGNPVTFKITVEVVPLVTLPKYRRLAKEIFETKEEITVSENEFTEVITRLIEMRASESQKPENDYPREITDKIVKTFGNFKNVAEFKEKVKTNLKEEKEQGIRRQKREALLDKLIEQTKVTLPEKLLRDESEALKEKRECEAKRMGSTMQEYLASIKKTEKEIEEEERGFVERNLKTHFIIEAIGREGNLEIKPEEIENDVVYLKTRYPHVRPEALTEYVRNALLTEKVFRFLEELSP